MRRHNTLGILLLVIGIIILLNALNVIPVNIFFNGWWTLFLIVPALMSMSRQGITAGNAILLVLGVGFLLREQGWDYTQYIVPALFIAVGLVIIFRR
ncbi:LiaI-LiaF-like domain-containing protein [Candidatus Izemoplasma sp. B36]|uniref:LiaF transmembrane domain-containing protein n=1 Tax=Candidatus Izemoplasma sp. B36 TaxID=3242468 RepID=UPI0035567D9B